MDFQTEIETLIRARYPIIYLITGEELRAQEVLVQIANKRQKRIFEWTSTGGIMPAGTSIQSHKGRNLATKDPLAALDNVIEQVEPAIYLFKDFHPFLARNQVAVIRRLKDIALHLKNSQKTIVLISSVLEIPPELDKEITVINLPQPTKDDLGGLLDSIIREVEPLEQVQVELDGEGRERLLQAALGLSLAEAENVFAKVMIKDQRLGAEHVNDVFAEKQQIVRKSGLLEYYAAEEDFGSVGGLSVLKDWLMKRAAAFTAEAQAFGLPAPKGILLLGVQGCGKSLCAKAVSRLWQLPLLRFDMGRMFGSLVGSSEENVRRAISVAESIAPAVLWVDEVDKAFVGSQSSAMTDGGTTARVFGTFLTWLSEKTAPVFVVATANEVAQLPPELLRKGRFDEIFYVDLPSEQERADIFTIHLAKRKRQPSDFDLPTLVSASRDFSGAEIEQAIISAMYDAFYEKQQLATAHILEALQQTVPLARTMAEKVTDQRQWAVGRARSANLARVNH
jgi:hypothetical protein